MNSLADVHLIVGLGNPGLAYEETRHNIGFVFVRKFAREHGVTLNLKKDFKGEFGQTIIDDRKVMFLLPTTYMNLSGEAVKKCCDFFKIPLDHVMVVCDDVALELGKLRVRPKGSCGGHNGLRDIERCMQSMHTPRMRVGVGLDQSKELADYVLARFSNEETKVLAKTFESASKVLMTWLTHDIDKAIEEVGRIQNKNKHPRKQQSIEDEKTS